MLTIHAIRSPRRSPWLDVAFWLIFGLALLAMTIPIFAAAVARDVWSGYLFGAFLGLMGIGMIRIGVREYRNVARD